MDKIHPLMGWSDANYHVDVDWYFLPRQNVTQGKTGDGRYVCDLAECSDFMVVLPVSTKDTSDNMYAGLHLYGAADPQLLARQADRLAVKIASVCDLIDALADATQHPMLRSGSSRRITAIRDVSGESR